MRRGLELTPRAVNKVNKRTNNLCLKWALGQSFLMWSNQYASKSGTEQPCNDSMRQISGCVLFILCFMANFIFLTSFDTQCHISLLHLSVLSHSGETGYMNKRPCNAGINLTSYHPPPRLTPGPLIFSIKIPTPGTALQCKTPAPGSRKRNKIPTPGHNLPGSNAKISIKKKHDSIRAVSFQISIIVHLTIFFYRENKSL